MQIKKLTSKKSNYCMSRGAFSYSSTKKTKKKTFLTFYLFNYTFNYTLLCKNN